MSDEFADLDDLEMTYPAVAVRFGRFTQLVRILIADAATRSAYSVTQCHSREHAAGWDAWFLSTVYFGHFSGQSFYSVLSLVGSVGMDEDPERVELLETIQLDLKNGVTRGCRIGRDAALNGVSWENVQTICAGEIARVCDATITELRWTLLEALGRWQYG